MNRRLVLLLALLLAAFLPATAYAIDVQGDLLVTVQNAETDAPIAGATVRVQDRDGGRAPVTGTTDAEGKALFRGLPIGDYAVEITHPDHEPDRYLVKVAPDVDNVLTTLLDVKGGEQVIRIRDTRLFVNTNNPTPPAAKRDDDFLNKQITNRDSLQKVLSTVPGLQANSLGQVHARGEHKSLSVSVDGVNLPVPMQSSVGNIIDPEFIDDLEVHTGSFDASYGGQLGAVMNIDTRRGTKDPYYEFQPTIGTFGTYRGMFRTGGASEDGTFDYFAGVKVGRTDNRIEPAAPDAQTLNNDGTDSSFLVRLNKRNPGTRGDDFGLTLSYTGTEFGIPLTRNNFDAGVRNREADSNGVALFSWKSRFNKDSDLLFGLAYQRSSQRITNNGVFTPWTAVDAGANEELAEEGFPANPELPGYPYLPDTDLVIQQVQPSLDYTWRIGTNHRFKAGLSANFIDSRQRVDVLDAGGGGGLPNPTTVAGTVNRFQADIARRGFLGGVYLSHTVPLAEGVLLNYGVRGDTFDDGVQVNTGQISPLVNFTLSPAEGHALRLSYNRLFQAPPLEIDATGANFALPQRTDLYEISYEAELAPALVGRAAYVHKYFRDQLDVALLIHNAAIPIYAPTNFADARYDAVELSLTSYNKTGWNGFLSSTFATGRPLTPGANTVEFPAYNDHDQRVQITGGVSHTWDNGLTAGTDFYYGSGYPQEVLPLYNSIGIFPYGLSGDRIPRYIQNVNVRYFPPDAEGEGKSGMGVGLEVQNLFDNREVLNFLSHFSGTRFLQGRRVLLQGLFQW